MTWNIAKARDLMNNVTADHAGGETETGILQRIE